MRSGEVGQSGADLVVFTMNHLQSGIPVSLLLMFQDGQILNLLPEILLFHELFDVRAVHQ